MASNAFQVQEDWRTQGCEESKSGDAKNNAAPKESKIWAQWKKAKLETGFSYHFKLIFHKHDIILHG